MAPRPRRVAARPARPRRAAQPRPAAPRRAARARAGTDPTRFAATTARGRLEEVAALVRAEATPWFARYGWSAEEILERARLLALPARIVGRTGGTDLRLKGEAPLPLTELRAAHEGWFASYMGGVDASQIR